MPRTSSFSIEDEEVIREYSQFDKWKTIYELAKEIPLSPRRIHNYRNNHKLLFRNIAKPINCSVCEKEFIPRLFKQHLCSDECRNYWSIYHRRRKKIVHKCKFCDEEFLGTEKQKYCSPQCLEDWRRKYRTIHRRIISECKNCSKKFESDGRKKYCSHVCKIIYRNKIRHCRLTYRKICETCGKEFEGENRRKYCSERCRQQHNRKSFSIIVRCKYCNKEFEGHSSRKFCSHKCCKEYFSEKGFCRRRKEHKSKSKFSIPLIKIIEILRKNHHDIYLEIIHNNFSKREYSTLRQNFSDTKKWTNV